MRPKPLLAVVCAVVFAALALLPVRTTAARLGLVGAGVAACGGAAAACRRPLARAAALGPLALGAFGLLPARPPEPDGLAAAYVRAVAGYEGVRYVWGGETSLGIDCSGLVRVPLARAALGEGLRRLDGGLVRTAAALWWRDASAATLGRGFDGRADLVTEAASVNALATDGLRPGDFAVTRDGVHALVYVGEGAWVEADPGRGRVIRARAPAPAIAWFHLPVRVLRWRLLARAEST